MTDRAGLRAQLDEYAEKFAAVDGYASLVRVLRAAASALDPGWQPIETAPKDGTVFIGRKADGEVARVHWCEHYPSHGWGLHGCFIAAQYTHWIPDPPLAGAREP